LTQDDSVKINFIGDKHSSLATYYSTSNTA